MKKRRFIEQMVKVEPEKDRTKASHKAIDPATAGELLSLIPSADKKALQDPITPASTPLAREDHEPPKDVFRDKGPILLLVGPPGVGKTWVMGTLYVLYQ